MAYYLDTSALVKLVVSEPESKALLAWLAAAEREPVACDLVRTELLRAVGRVDPSLMVQARQVLEAVTLLDVPTSVFEAAARLNPPTLRTLGAIHLAAALDLGDDLAGIVSYDTLLSDAAQQNGIPVSSPA